MDFRNTREIVYRHFPILTTKNIRLRNKDKIVSETNQWILWQQQQQQNDNNLRLNVDRIENDITTIK